MCIIKTDTIKTMAKSTIDRHLLQSDSELWQFDYINLGNENTVSDDIKRFHFLSNHLEKENSSEKSVVVFEEVEEEKADAKTQGQAAQGDEAELPAGLSILFLVFGASVVRVSLELPLVVVGHQLAQGD